MRKKTRPTRRSATASPAPRTRVPPERMAEVIAILTELLLAEARRAAGDRTEVRDELEDHR